MAMDIQESATEITKAWLEAMSSHPGTPTSWLMDQISAEKVSEFYTTIFKAINDAYK